MIPEDETKYHKTWYERACKSGLTSAEAFPLKPFTGYCDAARKNGYVLNYDGKVHKCTLAMFHEEYKEIECIGQLDNKGDAHIDENKLAKWIVKPNPIRKSCKKCKLFPLCVDGSCPFQSNIMKIHKCNRLEEVVYAQLKCMDNKNTIEYLEEM